MFYRETRLARWGLRPPNSQVRGTLDNVMVSKLAMFVVDNLGVECERNLFKVDFHLMFPYLLVTGVYNVSGESRGHSKLYGDGGFSRVEQDYLMYPLLNVNFENLLGGGDAGVFINELLGYMADMILSHIRDKMDDYLANILLDYVNSRLQGCTRGQVEGFVRAIDSGTIPFDFLLLFYTNSKLQPLPQRGGIQGEKRTKERRRAALKVGKRAIIIMNMSILIATLALVAAVACSNYSNAAGIAAKTRTPMESALAIQAAVKTLVGNNSVDDAIIKALENLRAEMKTGNAELNIPPLEPLQIQHLDFNLGEDLAVVNGSLDNLYITGLSSFVIDEISNDLANLKASFGISFTEVDFKGIYDISGRVLNSLDIFGNGPFTLNLTELHTKGDVVISSEDGTENSPIVITSLDIDFTLEGFKANFANILGGGDAGDLINSIINDNGLDIISQYKEEIRSFISKTFIGFVNELLQSYTLKEILDYLGVIRSSR
uniref:Uncharacterized protein n=1 Tax=Timema bartmani TaxID=61472 RepID=A0A7R9I206_9NEOP|nr:unnamed protein product [Timema bartmani]